MVPAPASLRIRVTALSMVTAVALLVGSHERADGAQKKGVRAPPLPLVPNDGGIGDNFGGSVSVNAATVLVGASRHAVHGVRSGAVYVFGPDGPAWAQLAELTAADGGTGDRFGEAVALDAGIAIVGAPGKGAAYVFVQNGATWTQQARLTPSDTLSASQQQAALAPVAVPQPIEPVAAPAVQPGMPSPLFAGTALGTRSGSGSGAGTASGSRSGSGSGSGSRSSPSAPVGPVPLFADPGSEAASPRSPQLDVVIAGAPTPLPTRIGIPPDPPSRAEASSDDLFGASVAIRGGLIIIGAPGRGAGAAYIFRSMGGIWQQQAELRASDGRADHRFGASVAVDGTTAAVGAPGDGAAYVFGQSGVAWSELAKLAPGDSARGFGASVALSGTTALVGAAAAGAGAGYLFAQSSAFVFTPSVTRWSQQMKLVSSAPVAGDGLGSSVALGTSWALLGAPGSDEMGAGFLFGWTGSTWVESTSLSPTQRDSHEGVGQSVALGGPYAVVGSSHEPGGAAYIFVLGRMFAPQ